MKRIILTVFIALSLVPAYTQTKQEKAVADAVVRLRNAMTDANKTALENLTFEQLSYGHSGGLIENKKEFVEKIVSGRSDFVSIDLSEQTISVSGRTAVVRHILKAKTNDGGKPGDVQLRILLVWQKKAGKWKLLARQAVKMN